MPAVPAGAIQRRTRQKSVGEMSVIYRERDGVRYSELSCPDCAGDKFVVSQNALDFYADQSPALPYLCPQCRRRRNPRSTLYGLMHQMQPAAI